MRSNLMKSVSSLVLAHPKERATMRAYKLLTAGIGTLLLGLAAVTPAQAGIALNGIALNGIALNGIALNGISMNGISMNGVSVNGLGLAVPAQAAPLALKVLSMTLPATKVE
jgi:hypothetical protein